MTTWLTPQEAGGYARCSERTIRDTVKAGNLPAYTFGGGKGIRLKAEDIDSWLESQPWEPAR